MSDDDLGLLDASGAFRVGGTGWYLDAREGCGKVVVSHGHSDHLGRGHGMVVATKVTCELMRHRLAEPGEIFTGGPAAPLEEGAERVGPVATKMVELEFGEKFVEGDVCVELFSAGHVLGSAMARVTTPRGRLLYTGDFRWRGDAVTVPACDPPTDGADAVLMECTYGLAKYRFEERRAVVERLCEMVRRSLANGKQPVCLCYSLGKAQEIARSLCDAGFGVVMHGAGIAITKIYECCGVEVGDVGRYVKGESEGRVLIVPPHVRNSRMVTGISNAEIFVITGWALDSSAKYRYKADHALAISDHADFSELNEFVDAMRERGVKRFYLTHGFVKEFGRHLRGRGVDARPARPSAQLALFDD